MSTCCGEGITFCLSLYFLSEGTVLLVMAAYGFCYPVLVFFFFCCRTDSRSFIPILLGCHKSVIITFEMDASCFFGCISICKDQIESSCFVLHLILPFCILKHVWIKIVLSSQEILVSNTKQKILMPIYFVFPLIYSQKVISW